MGLLVFLGIALIPVMKVPITNPFSPAKGLTQDDATYLLGHLLRNVYRAFDFRDESDVYDRLSMSVMGDQLTQIYLQNRQSLELENRGGAMFTLRAF